LDNNGDSEVIKKKKGNSPYVYTLEGLYNLVEAASKKEEFTVIRI
jgi:hypothetical protein